MSLLASYAPIFPEIVLALGAMALLMYGVFASDDEATGERAAWGAIFVLLAAAVLLAQAPAGTRKLFDGAFINDAFARFMKLIVLGASAVSILLSIDHLKDHRIMKFEYPVLILLSAAGMGMMISANDLIALYLGLELQSLALYVVAAFRRDSVRSSEAGLKYFVLGALSSGMLLYGASLVYGFTGSTSFEVIAAVAQGKAAADNIGLIFGLVFLLVGLAFKVSAVPFHMWTPDVYEGSPTPITAFFAAAPKAAAMALLLRIVLGAFPGALAQWQQIIVFIALASMLLGAFAAIGQSNIKRLMAYSSIANIGFALVGLAAGTPEGVQGVLVYMAIYVVMTLGAFACILSMRRGGRAVEEISELAGLAQNNLAMAFVLAMLLFSLAGIPFLAGFFAKLYVFLAAVKADLWLLAIVGVLASVVGAYYYLRIVKIMFFDEARERFESVRPKQALVMGLACLFVLLAFLPIPFMPGQGIVGAAAAAARSFRFL
jgi:NADH-quinone oxidoreductase subunit N